MRVAAQRRREVMCIMEYQEAKWLDFDECSLEGLEIPTEETAVSGTPILLPEDRPASSLEVKD